MMEQAELDELRGEIRRLGTMLNDVLQQNRHILEALAGVQQHTGKIDRLEASIAIINQLVRDTDRDTHEVDRKVSNIKIPRRFL